MIRNREKNYSPIHNYRESGKAAYYPQCDNFWTNVCHKKIKDGANCKDCKNRYYKTIASELMELTFGNNDSKNNLVQDQIKIETNKSKKVEKSEL